jgi:hypothetical protein
MVDLFAAHMPEEPPPPQTLCSLCLTLQNCVDLSPMAWQSSLGPLRQGPLCKNCRRRVRKIESVQPGDCVSVEPSSLSERFGYLTKSPYGVMAGTKVFEVEVYNVVTEVLVFFGGVLHPELHWWGLGEYALIRRKPRV